jgi:hypothetical protein
MGAGARMNQYECMSVASENKEKEKEGRAFCGHHIAHCIIGRVGSGRGIRHRISSNHSSPPIITHHHPPPLPCSLPG